MSRLARVVAVSWVLGWVGPALADEVVVTEGKGLANVYIGQDGEAALKAMGPPSENLYGFVFLYKMPDGTKFSYRVTDKQVTGISVLGSASSTYRVAGGARFGMSRKQIEQLYGAPDSQAANKIFYPHRGVSFAFIDDKMVEFNITAPK